MKSKITRLIINTGMTKEELQQHLKDNPEFVKAITETLSECGIYIDSKDDIRIE